MFLYILNLLHEGLRKKNEKIICDSSLYDIMRDTRYISELGQIKKNFDFGLIADKIGSIAEIFIKYNVDINDCFNIVEKLLQNKEKSWILESLYNSYPYNKVNNKFSIVCTIIYDIFEKYKIREVNYQIA